jgi:hypothetical protein
VSVLGGPYADVLGSREEQISNIACGARVDHEVSGLEPSTEYTIHVRLALPDGHALEEDLEARTANATTALFAEEDWGRSGAKGSKDCDDMKEKGRETGGASSSSMSSPGAASSSAAPAVAPARTDSQDDVSTNAPSETGEDNARRFEDRASDFGSEAGDRREEPVSVEAPVVHEEGGLDPVAAIEIESTPTRSIECKFFFDCFKLGRAKKPEAEIVVEQRQAVPKPAPKRRGFRPYRPAFPGTPVDPASVGLLPRHDVEVV